ncbi:MAG: hypothetical protein MJ092_07195 [Lachnospiraceae bacterium]|nr:hypothetical protein [Lachnospiraceae bacterium]
MTKLLYNKNSLIGRLYQYFFMYSPLYVLMFTPPSFAVISGTPVASRQ